MGLAKNLVGLPIINISDWNSFHWLLCIVVYVVACCGQLCRWPLIEFLLYLLFLVWLSNFLSIRICINMILNAPFLKIPCSLSMLYDFELKLNCKGIINVRITPQWVWALLKLCEHDSNLFANIINGIITMWKPILDFTLKARLHRAERQVN